MTSRNVYSLIIARYETLLQDNAY